MITYLTNLYKSFFATKTSRSSAWPKVRNTHLVKEPTCQACGTDKNLNVHHIIPYHLDKDKELDGNNLITLCEEHHCHLVIGHLCSWSSYNKNVIEDAAIWLKKVKNRP